MKGIQYWECRKHEREAGVLNEEANPIPAAAKLTAAKRSKCQGAGRSGWKGPGTLWIAKDDPPRKS